MIQSYLLQRREKSCKWHCFDIQCIFVGMKSTPFQIKVQKLVKHTDGSMYIYTRTLKLVDKMLYKDNVFVNIVVIS